MDKNSVAISNKRRSDFECAEKLNKMLFAPSTCYELCLKGFEHIVCGEHPDSRFLAEHLADEIESNTEKRPTIDIIKELDYTSQSLFDLVSVYGLHDAKSLKLDYTKALFICTEVAFVNFKSFLPEVTFCIKDRLFRQKFIEKNDGFLQKEQGQPFGSKKLVNADFVVAYEDDMSSVIEACKLWWELRRLYGKNGPNNQPRIFICLGGKGKFSTYLYRKEEKDMQEITAINLMVNQDDIAIIDAGMNIGSHLKELAKVVGDNTAIVVLAQRQSLIWEASRKKQFPDRNNIRILTIYKTVEESCLWMNGLRLNNGAPVLHFWAHVISRCDRHRDEFMIPIDGIPNYERSCAKQLMRKYYLKQKGYYLYKFFQFISILFSLSNNHQKVWNEYELMIERATFEIEKRYINQE